MTRSKTRLFSGRKDSPYPICLNCEDTKQGRPCNCADTFVQGDGGAPVKLLKLAIEAEKTYLKELGDHLAELGQMRFAAAAANAAKAAAIEPHDRFEF